MKKIPLIIILCLLVGSLTGAAFYEKNNIKPSKEFTPPDDYINQDAFKPKPNISGEMLSSLLVKDGVRYYPPKPMHITEKWDDGYFPQLEEPNPKSPYVTFVTNKGDIHMVLYPEAAPLTVKNFIVHCQEGYYDNTKFHNVVKDFMIQGGDPTGTGNGGENIYGTPFRDEINDHLHHFRGALAMMNWGTYMNGSQFYIVQGNKFKKTFRDEKADKYKMQIMLNKITTEAYTTAYDYLFFEAPSDKEFQKKLNLIINKSNRDLEKGYFPDINIDKAIDIYKEIGGSPHLDNQYTVFGQVIKGMEVVDQIADMSADEVKTKPAVINRIIVKNAPDYGEE